MTLSEVETLTHYWGDFPPAHEMLRVVAALLGWKGPDTSKHPPSSGPSSEFKPSSEDEIRSFVSQVKGMLQ